MLTKELILKDDKKCEDEEEISDSTVPNSESCRSLYSFWDSIWVFVSSCYISSKLAATRCKSYLY